LDTALFPPRMYAPMACESAPHDREQAFKQPGAFFPMLATMPWSHALPVATDAAKSSPWTPASTCWLTSTAACAAGASSPPAGTSASGSVAAERSN